MNHAIELYFDKASTQQIDALRHRLVAHGIPIDAGTRPHISLALYQDLNEPTLIDSVRTFALRKCDLGFTLGSVGVFASNESVVFLAPKITHELLSFHADFLNFMQASQQNLNPYYDVNNWIPHCTLGLNLNDRELTDAIRIIKEFDHLPIRGTILQIGVLAFPPNKEIFSTPFLNSKTR